MEKTLNSNDLARFIEDEGITAVIIRLDTPTKTVTDAAAALGVQPEQIIKSVLFLADGAPVLVITNGLTRIRYKALADFLGLSRRRLKMADAAQVLAITGYVVGSVPPFGHLQPIRTVVDTAVTQLPHTHIYGGGGDINALLQITPAELLRIFQKQNEPTTIDGLSN
ncbi:MAG TPA: YbaK/EbsC family protein [Anaerolineae bacterium]|nr:YbaK/EbsC family protein [Anaerolineae bacterium]